MLDRIFSVVQRDNEPPSRFLARVAVRVLSVVAGLAVFTYCSIVLFFPLLYSLPYAPARFLGAFVLILAVLATGAAALGGIFAIVQITWKVGASRKTWLEVVPDALRILVLFLLCTFGAYLFIRGLVLGEVDHVSHRIKESYRVADEPMGYFVHMFFYIALTAMLYWYMFKLFITLVRRFRVLAHHSSESPSVPAEFKRGRH